MEAAAEEEETLSFIIPQCVFGFSFQNWLFSIFHLFFPLLSPANFLLLSANTSPHLSDGIAGVFQWWQWRRRHPSTIATTAPDDCDGYESAIRGARIPSFSSRRAEGRGGGAIIIIVRPPAEYVFIYRKNVIINCVD